MQEIQIINKSIPRIEPLRKVKISDTSLKKAPVKVVIVPVMLELYESMFLSLKKTLHDFSSKFCASLSSKDVEVVNTPVVTNSGHLEKQLKELSSSKVDMLVIAHLCYAPSGQLVSALMNNNLPLLLWPAQPMFELIPENYDSNAVCMNHGIHGTIDLANVLRKRGKNFGVLIGHWQDELFKNSLSDWARAGYATEAMKTSNPVVIGSRFEDMLDLQMDKELFLKKLGVKANYLSINDFAEIAWQISEKEINRRITEYNNKFIIHSDCKEELLKKTVKHELALRQFLCNYDSSAFGINFIDACNHDIADALHVPASILMSEGKGYAGEGDWETAMFMCGLQKAFGVSQASFTEIFSVGYKDSRLVLRHWGEGNISMAREKSVLAPSIFENGKKVEFAICDFEFQPGPAMLVNFNSTSRSEGQIISISGTVEPNHLPKDCGPRAIFKPEKQDVKEVLTNYCSLGGSHHLVLVKDGSPKTLDKLAKLNGWRFFEI